MASNSAGDPISITITNNAFSFKNNPIEKTKKKKETLNVPFRIRKGGQLMPYVNTIKRINRD